MDHQNLVMFPLELIMFTILSFGIMKSKNSFPNLMFPPADINVYLPP